MEDVLADTGAKTPDSPPKRDALAPASPLRADTGSARADSDRVNDNTAASKVTAIARADATPTAADPGRDQEGSGGSVESRGGAKGAAASAFPYPGHVASTKRGRYLYAAAFLDSMFTDTRLKQRERTASSCVSSTTWWASCVCVALYFPLGLALMILRVGVFFPSAASCVS